MGEAGVLVVARGEGARLVTAGLATVVLGAVARGVVVLVAGVFGAAVFAPVLRVVALLVVAGLDAVFDCAALRERGVAAGVAGAFAVAVVGVPSAAFTSDLS